MHRLTPLICSIALIVASCSKPDPTAIQPQPSDGNLPASTDLNSGMTSANSSGSSSASTGSSPTKLAKNQSVAVRPQPAAKVLVCAVTTDDALKKDHTKKPEHCRIVEVRTMPEATSFKCNKFFELSRVFKGGNYSCDVNVLQCLPGVPCEFADFPCKTPGTTEPEFCSGVKKISLSSSKPKIDTSSR
ncbi:MAG: hypothetical protein HC866_21475 [Leptolyngbyaceae cyanobacterium RU_5_1]|nr:hypothetical protein [Leptolyngbyaceae cyanobacterium RU_5_1]